MMAKSNLNVLQGIIIKVAKRVLANPHLYPPSTLVYVLKCMTLHVAKNKKLRSGRSTV